MAYINGNQIPFNPVVNQVVLDEQMSDTSINGVQNKVIKEYIDNTAPVHGTWTPVFSDTHCVSDMNICDCIYTILNEKEAYIHMLLAGTSGNDPTMSNSNFFTGFPISISESVLMSSIPIVFTDGMNPTSSGNSVSFFNDGSAQLNTIPATANSDFSFEASGIIIYA